MNDKAIKKLLDLNKHKILDENFNHLVISKLKRKISNEMTSQYLDEEMIVFSSVFGILLIFGIIVLKEYFKENSFNGSQDILNSIGVISVGALVFAFYFIVSNLIDKKMTTHNL